MDMATYCKRQGMTLEQYKQYQSNIKAAAQALFDLAQKYIIMRLVKLDIVFKARKCLYNDFELASEIHERCDVDYEIEELNIA